jgi:hypothetical protein
MYLEALKKCNLSCQTSVLNGQWSSWECILGGAGQQYHSQAMGGQMTVHLAAFELDWKSKVHRPIKVDDVVARLKKVFVATRNIWVPFAIMI